MFPGLVVGIEDGQDAERTRGAMPPIQLCIGLIALLAPLNMILPGCQQREVGADNPNTMLATGNHSPVVRAVTLRPSPLVLTGPIVAQVEAQDVDRNPLSFRYRWIINRQQVPNQDSEQLSPELLKRGDAVKVEVWPHDGMVEGRPFTSELFVVTNSPPVVSNLTFEPASVFPGVPVQARGHVPYASRDVVRDASR